MEAFHSDGSCDKTSKSEYEERNGFFNGLDADELLQERHGEEVIDFSHIDQSIEKYSRLKEVVSDATAVELYADDETTEKYFEQLFRDSLGMRLTQEEHSYSEIVHHLAALNSELDEEALKQARRTYRFVVQGENDET